MRKVIAFAVVAALVAAATTTALGSNQAPSTIARADTALLKCGKTRTFGFAAPITGLAASLGQQMLHWSKFYVRRYNRSHRKKLRMIQGDTQLPKTEEAVKVAEKFASNGSILAVSGPAGSQEVVASTAPLRKAGLGFISGTATRTSLTDGSRKGFFFRTVPNDDQQGPRVANYIDNTLKKKRITIIDDQEAYGLGLSDTVEKILKARGLTVRRDSVDPATTSDFSSLIARIPANQQVVYLPWQLSAKAQAFGQQLRQAGKKAILFGSDGLFDPDNFKIVGSYVSFFPVDLNSKVIAAYMKSHGGKSELFGVPTYQGVDAIARAIGRSCKDGKATRKEVRKQIAKTKIPKSQSLLGFAVGFFSTNPAGPQGPGDLKNPANFGIYKIEKGGKYVRVS